MDGWFTGPGGLTFTGPGTCVFNGAANNNFTGTFNVEEGDVYLDNFVTWYGDYTAVNTDEPSLAGSLTVGMASNSVPANLFVQRSEQFGTNCDITVNPTGFIEFDRQGGQPGSESHASLKTSRIPLAPLVSSLRLCRRLI